MNARMNLMTRMSRLAAVATAALILAGCNMPRPLPSVWESGDRAFSRGDFEKASADYGEYLDRKPGEARVQLRMAETLLELGRPEEAVEWATIAYDQRPGDEQFIEVRARALFEAGHTDELHTFLRTLAQDRNRVGDFIRLGQYTARLGDPDGAEHALLMAARIDGGTTLWPQVALADFYESIGDTENAKRRLRMALFFDTTNREINARLRAMGEIPGPSFAIRPDEAN